MGVAIQFSAVRFGKGVTVALKGIVCGVVMAAFSLGAYGQAGAGSADPIHVWAGSNDPAALETWVNARVAASKADIDKVTVVTGAHTVENTLAPFDDAQNELALAGNEAYMMFAVGDSVALRIKGQAMVAAISSASTDLALNQKV